MTGYLIALGLVALFLGGVVIYVQLSGRRLFTLLTFSAILFVLEATGGAAKALYPGPVFTEFASTDYTNPRPWTPWALIVYIVGFTVFVYGYAIAAFALRVGKRHREDVTERYFSRVWTPSYRLLLVAVTVFSFATGFAQQFQRVRAMGGLSAYAAAAYQERWGLGTENLSEGSAIILANLTAVSAVGFAVMWMIAWLRGKLSTVGKIGVVVFLLLLFLRQWTTTFRAPLIFTSLALIAAFAAERRIRIKPLIVVGLILAVLFAGVNFLHIYMHYRTAGWDKPTVVSSLAQFLGPHAHLFTLATIVRAKEAGIPHLNGDGLPESVLFFIPRSIWPSKAPSVAYGTPLVQLWAGLPTHYQMAVTLVGEFFAHFSYLGMALMALFGALYGLFDSFAERSVELRAGLYGILLSRVMADTGMGVSAISLTVVCLLLFLGLAAFARLGSAIYDWIFHGTWRMFRTSHLEAS
jgi:hypothetical protein